MFKRKKKAVHVLSLLNNIFVTLTTDGKTLAWTWWDTRFKGSRRATSAAQEWRNWKIA